MTYWLPHSTLDAGRRNGRLTVPEGARAVDLECEVDDPAVQPGFAGLETPQIDMVRIGLLGLIATSNLAAGGAHPEVNPARTDPEAVLTALGAGSYVGKLVGGVGAIVAMRGSVEPIWW